MNDVVVRWQYRDGSPAPLPSSEDLRWRNADGAYAAEEGWAYPVEVTPMSDTDWHANMFLSNVATARVRRSLIVETRDDGDSLLLRLVDPEAHGLGLLASGGINRKDVAAGQNMLDAEVAEVRRLVDVMEYGDGD